jgi:hypothetical protein
MASVSQHSGQHVLPGGRRHGRGRSSASGVGAAVRRSRWRLVLLVGGAVLVVYYGLVLAGMRDRDSSAVALDDTGVAHPADRVTVQAEAVELDPSTGSLELRLQPVPRGTVAAAREAGQLRQPLVMEVTSAGQPPQSFDFPADQVVDPVVASAATTTGAHRFPFDRVRSELRIEALSRGRPVPVDVEVTDETDGWSLSGRARETGGADGAVGAVDGVDLRLDAGREMLPISFALLYIAGIVVVALITVAVIGGAIARGRVDFDQVIWLGAMLVAIPAVRNEMPGVPPIGTAVDLFVFLPSVVVVGLALLAAIVVLAVNEAAAADTDDEGEFAEDGADDDGDGEFAAFADDREWG